MTSMRSTEVLQRVFVDFSRKNDTMAAVAGNLYCMIIRDDYTRFIWSFLMKHMSHASKASEVFLGVLVITGKYK